MALKAKRTMDRKLVSSQSHEVEYLAKKHRLSRQIIRDAHKVVGRSREKVEAYLAGYKAANQSA